MMKVNYEKELLHLTLQKWLINKTWMRQKDFEKFIFRKLHLEKFQDSLILQLQNCFGDLHGKKVLDIGCGEGGLVVALNLLGINACGIDLNEENIKISQIRAKKNGLSPAIFKKANSCTLPFDNNSFELVTLISVLEHVEDIDKTLSEVSRVLKKGGYLFAIVPNKYYPIEGHVNLWFVHWLPSYIRRVILDTLRKEKAKSLNYLEDINYLGPAQWYKLLFSYFSRWYDVRNITFENVVYGFKKTESSSSKIMNCFKHIAFKTSKYPLLKALVFQLYKYFQPRIYLIARK